MSVYIETAGAGRGCYKTAACQKFLKFHQKTVDDVDFYMIKAAQVECSSSSEECPSVLKAVATLTKSDICHVKEEKEFLIDTTLFEGFDLTGPIMLGTKGDESSCAALTMTIYDLAEGTEFSCSPKVVKEGSQDVIATRQDDSENLYTFKDTVTLAKLLNFVPVDPGCPMDMRRARQHIVKVERIL
jgi:hypothetical protein